MVYFRGVLCDHEVQPMAKARSQGGHSVPWISGNSQGYQNNFFNFQHQQGEYNKTKRRLYLPIITLLLKKDIFLTLYQYLFQVELRGL